MFIVRPGDEEVDGGESDDRQSPVARLVVVGVFDSEDGLEV
jgi:hypothetical protein